MFALQGEIALITGASRGIGRSIALNMGQQGALIVGTSTSDLGAKGVTAALSDTGIEGIGTVLDVTDSENVVNVVRQIEENFGPISILVNNAGIARDNLLLRMKEEEWDDILETNLSSVFRVTKACLRGMIRARRGRVINVTSIVAATGNPGQTNYAASKAGLVGFTKSLASEVASRGITVNAISPGALNTRMLDEVLEAGPKKVGVVLYEKFLQQKESGGEPLGTGAALAIFLASSKSDGITGKLISAVWDEWEKWPQHLNELNSSDVYTLRRIAGRDRNITWGDK